MIGACSDCDCELICVCTDNKISDLLVLVLMVINDLISVCTDEKISDLISVCTDDKISNLIGACSDGD